MPPRPKPARPTRAKRAIVLRGPDVHTPGIRQTGMVVDTKTGRVLEETFEMPKKRKTKR